MTEAALDFSEEDIQKMLDNIDSFSPDEVVEICLLYTSDAADE